MKRLFAAAAAALALAACTDGLLDSRAPEGRRPYIVWAPSDSIFTTQTPASSLDATGGWEVGTVFTTDDTILVTGFRFYKASGETGSHTARLWNSSGTQLISKAFGTESASGWQRVSLSTTEQLPPGTYTVSVNTNTWQAKTFGYFTSNGSISRSHLTATGGSYVSGVGNYPSNSSGSAYFADLIYRPKLCNTLTSSPCP